MSKLSQQFRVKRLRSVVLLFVAFVVFAGLAVYIQQYLYRSRAGVETDTVNLTFVQHTPVPVNQEFDLELSMISPSDKKITSVDLFLKFDESSDHVDFLSASAFVNDNASSPYFNSAPLIQEVQTYQNAKLLHVFLRDELKQSFSSYSNNVQVKFHMKAKSAGTVNFEIVKDPTVIAGSNATTNTIAYTISPESVTTSVEIIDGTTTPTTNPLTPSPTLPPGTAQVNIKARFQGITKNPPTELTAKVIFAPSGSTEKITKEVAGRISADGLWQGTTQIPVSNSSLTYNIYMQAPKYLKKKFCEIKPVATDDKYSCTQPRIPLVEGNNDLDFSGVYQLVGDVQSPYGVLDSLDIISIRSNLESTDQQKISLYDLNYNNDIEIQDNAMPIKALSLQNTDDE